MKKINIKHLVISIIISLFTGIFSTIITGNGITEYKDMYKPFLSPPAIIFPIVWTILYILMGISSYLIYESDSMEIQKALHIYAVSLILNALWPVWFFNLKAYTFAFIWLVVLWMVIIVMVNEFGKINRRAGILLLPYFFWVSFAGYLNLCIALN